MTQTHRVGGGHIDRSQPVEFTFDGKKYQGFSGDTVASALIANGVKLVGRSFKYHRPRGIFSAGSDEPNALMTIGEGARATPNTRATIAELYEGMTVQSQNRFPSLNFDVMAVNDLLAPFLSAGFYYKTFMWPASFWEKLYEPIIRRAAGLGALSGEPDPDQYDKGFLHCDVLVIGAGSAGLMTALVAGRAGLRVILADEDFQMGGRLLSELEQINGDTALAWTMQITAELSSMPNVRLMGRTTVYGVFDHGIYGAVTRNTDHLAVKTKKPRETLWRIYAKRSVLASGATERSIALSNNDRPGVMLASAVRTYANRFGALCGKRVVVVSNNSDGLRTANILKASGAEVSAVIDTRLSENSFDIRGRKAVRAIRFSDGRKVDADCIAISGGWNPNIQLTCHKRGRPLWRDDIAAFVPSKDALTADMDVAGAANGSFSTHQCLQEGAQAGARAVQALGKNAAAIDLPQADDAPFEITPFWEMKGCKGSAWVDPQNDVTAKDIKLAAQEGFKSVELLKRYTTLGMATDQGKASNVLGLAILADHLSQTIPETGTTISRPPYTPVSISAFAGASRFEHFRPVRKTPSHNWAQGQGAVFVSAGLWQRAQYFPRPGETHWRQTVDREVVATRSSVGICDVTTLGKIDIQGPDAGAFLNRIYVNAFAKLVVGKCRYGLMLREDGFAMDDGTVARFSDTHFVMTTTTANAVSVYRHLEFCRQCLWPNMDVKLISVTDQWAQYAIAGPNARKLLQKIVDKEHDVSNEAFSYMACGEITVCGGIRARLFRLSFSGELAYELGVPARYGDSLIKALMSVGEEFNAVPYGTEALGVMRIEKGHAAGNELNGQTTAKHLGMGRMLAKKKDFIGKTLSEREGLNAEDGLYLVGFKPVSRADTQTDALASGAHLIGQGKSDTAENSEGYLSSVAYSPSLKSYIGLGFLKRGQERIGQEIRAVDLLRGTDVLVTVCSAHFIDPKGERLRV
ncbi:MAG: sarcosine oxidase subunit alpha family protein [Robiginitomaculum sp.]|nr:sarcosine oxidase subunit alpha family protein [Robiginitomaculum sp.]